MPRRYFMRPGKPTEVIMTRSLRTLGWALGLSAAGLALAGSEPLTAGPIAGANALRNADEGATPVYYRGRSYAWYAPQQYYYPPSANYYGYYGPPAAYMPPVYGYYLPPPVVYYRPPAYAYRPPVYGYYQAPPARYYAPPSYYYAPRYRYEYEYDAAW
jgi:hypothetical protein